MRDRIVITGGAGFIGSNLARVLLEQGYAVTVVDNLSAGRKENLPDGADFHLLDIVTANLTPLLSGASAVFHLAAKNCLADCVADPVTTAQVNVAGTANIARQVATSGVPHLIYAGTSAEYEGVFDFPSKVNEVRPRSVYACSKRSGALMAESILEGSGTKLSFVRYFNVYGPAQDWRRSIPPVVSAFAMKLLAGVRPTIYGDGEKRRDFIHVDDVNRFHLKLLREPALQGRTFNLGSGRDYSVLEIFAIVESVVRSGLAPLHVAELPGEAFRTLADISETVATNWKPQVGLEEGVAAFITYARERLAR